MNGGRWQSSNSSVKHTQVQLEHQEEPKTRVQTRGVVPVLVTNDRENAVKVRRVNGNMNKRTAEVRDVNGNKKGIIRHDEYRGTVSEKINATHEKGTTQRVRANQQ